MYTTTTSPSFASSRASSLADSDYEAALNAHESTFAFNARESTFEADGVAARVFGAPQPGTVPLYHVAHPGTQDHFYTRDVRERDAKLVPSAAPQRANARRGLGPADGGAALRTGYIDAGVAAWVFARRVCGAVPLFRVYNPVIGAHFYTTDVVERDEKVRDDGYGEGVIAGFVIPA
ncbi:hypothetical protein FB451DRAFT_1016865 [Mycena latifolia]|nr:hypothetical protein FB451DRAFT_1016865 [Mycena latifolia]